MAKRNLRKKLRNLAVNKGDDAPVSGATLEDHRRDILSQARKFVRPLGVSKRKFLFMTAGILLGILLVLIGLFAVLIYRYKSDSSLVYGVSQIVPYPAVKLNGRLVYYGDYLFELRPLKHYIQNVASNSQNANQPVNFETPEGQQQLTELRQTAMEEAKRKAMASVMAEENNVSVSRREVNEAVQTEVSNQGGERKFLEAIEYYYGWSMDDFRRIIRSKLLEEKLRPHFSQQQKQTADDLLQKIRGGGDFAAVAKESSEDPGSKDEGGDLGLSSPGAYVKEFEEAAYKLEPGQVSDIVQTKHGFHIIKMTEKQGDQIRVSHILIRYGDLNAIISDRLSQADISQYVDIAGVKTD